jgi:hypothetical protein
MRTRTTSATSWTRPKCKVPRPPKSKLQSLQRSLAAATKFQLALTPPDFAQYRVNDLFRALGPIAIFSAKRHWTAPRLVQLHRGRTTDGFGFSVRGDAPVIVALVESNSLAEVRRQNAQNSPADAFLQFGGVKEGDFIVAISDKDVKWSSHDEVVALIKTAGDSLSLKLVTPMDRNYLKVSTAKTARQVI